MRAKFPAVDVVKLISQSHTEEWNSWLVSAYQKRDLNKLIAWRYGMNLGMDLAKKQKLDSDKLVMIWIRMQRSIEKTARKIITELYPFPDIKSDPVMHKLCKKKRDAEYIRFMRESSP